MDTRLNCYLPDCKHIGPFGSGDTIRLTIKCTNGSKTEDTLGFRIYTTEGYDAGGSTIICDFQIKGSFNKTVELTTGKACKYLFIKKPSIGNGIIDNV